MYEIEFYETEDGKCPIWDFLEALRLKAPTNKDARIQHKQASLYIELLQQNGTHMNAEITKHLDDGIWELRPGNNRVFNRQYSFVRRPILCRGNDLIWGIRQLYHSLLYVTNLIYDGRLATTNKKMNTLMGRICNDQGDAFNQHIRKK